MAKNTKKDTQSNVKSTKNRNYRSDNGGKRDNNRYTEKRQGRKETAFEKGISDPKNYINSYTTSKDNDPSWYMVNSELVKDACKIPTGNMVGEPLALLEADSGYPSINSYLQVSGIASLVVAPTVGYSADTMSAPSRAAVAITEFLRSKLTTDETFSTPDVFMYLNAMDSIYALYSYIVRLFGILSYVQFNNLYTPYALVHAGYGFDRAAFDDAIQNRANYLYEFNQYITEAQFLYMPTSFTAVERHSWLFSNVFYDSRSQKAQMYIHRPLGFYIWDEISHDTGTSNMFLDIYHKDQFGRDELNWSAYRGWYERHDMKELLKLFHNMCYAMINSTSQMRIRMAFLKAYENDPGWRMMEIAPNYSVVPTHSDEVLSQINNSTIDNDLNTYGYRADLYYPEGTVLPDGTPVSQADSFRSHPLDITQNPDTNAVECIPFILQAELNQSQIDRMYMKPTLNFHWDNPTVEDIAVATRDTTCYQYSLFPLNQPSWNLVGMGCDYLAGFVMYTIDPNTKEVIEESIPHLTISTAETTLPKLYRWLTFDWAPNFYLYNGTAQAPTSMYPLNEWDNYITVDKSSLIQLHKAILTSMYQVKEAGMYSGGRRSS